MSINIIGWHRDGIVLAADRRTMRRTLSAEIEIDHHLMVFFEGIQKTLALRPPHNWIGLVFFGNGIIGDGLFVEEFQTTLPAERMEPRHYAERLLEYTKDVLKKNPVPDTIKTSGHRSNIAIAGFGKHSRIGQVFLVTPEKDEISDKTGDGKPWMTIGGVGTSARQAFHAYIDEMKSRLLVKAENTRQLGVPISKREQTLLNTLNGRTPNNVRDLLTFAEQIELAKFTVRFTADELLRLDEWPAVGHECDVIKITSSSGAQFLEGSIDGADFLELVDTNKNHIMMKCCGQEVHFQLHIDEEFPVAKGFRQLPKDLTFRCATCRSKFGMGGLIEDLKNEDWIVD